MEGNEECFSAIFKMILKLFTGSSALRQLGKESIVYFWLSPHLCLDKGRISIGSSEEFTESERARHQALEMTGYEECSAAVLRLKTLMGSSALRRPGEESTVYFRLSLHECLDKGLISIRSSEINISQEARCDSPALAACELGKQAGSTLLTLLIKMVIVEKSKVEDSFFDTLFETHSLSTKQMTSSLNVMGQFYPFQYDRSLNFEAFLKGQYTELVDQIINQVKRLPLKTIMSCSPTNADIPVVKDHEYDLLKPHLHKGAKNQYAFAIILFKDGKQKEFPCVTPKKDGDDWKHAEIKLIEDINEHLKQKGVGAEVKLILIYTYYSPCIKQCKVSCMYQLMASSHQWHVKYKVNTHVIFTEYWGLSGKFTYSNIFNDPDPEALEKISFKVNFQKLHPQKIGKQFKAFMSAQKALKDLANTDSTYSEHMESGESKISTLTFHPDILENLRVYWKESVEKSFKKAVDEQLSPHLNVQVVQCFVYHYKTVFGESNPVSFYQTSESMANRKCFDSSQKMQLPEIMLSQK